MKKILLLTAILITGGLSIGSAQNSWTQIEDFMGLRTGATGFSIGSKGYVGTGNISVNGFINDFWEYDPLTSAWTQKADFGGNNRQNAVGFVIGSKGYLGTGEHLYSKLDFWEYDPATNHWTQKADFGGGKRSEAVGFSIGNKGYVATGEDGNSYKNDLWEYDPATNHWTQKADFAGTARVKATGFSIGNKGYVGTGNSSGVFYNDFWEYNPVTDVWVQKADFSGGNRWSAMGFSIGNKGYIGTGEDGVSSKNDFWEYDPATNLWTQKADFGGTARIGAAGFSVSGKGYIGTGAADVYLKDFWEYTPQCSIAVVYADADSDYYGDAGSSVPGTDCEAPDDYVYDSTDCNDANSNIFPGATEIGNAIDDDCDGFTDEFGVGINGVSPALSFFIFPVPANRFITVSATLSHSESLIIKVLDLAGRELFLEKEVSATGVFSKQLDLLNFSSGTYVMQINHDGQNEIIKLVVAQ